MTTANERIILPKDIFAKLQQKLARAAAVASLASLNGTTDLDETVERELPKLVADLVNEAYEAWGELAIAIWDFNERPSLTAQEVHQ